MKTDLPCMTGLDFAVKIVVISLSSERCKVFQSCIPRQSRWSADILLMKIRFQKERTITLVRECLHAVKDIYLIVLICVYI